LLLKYIDSTKNLEKENKNIELLQIIDGEESVLKATILESYFII
jgi:hypothetical protein